MNRHLNVFTRYDRVDHHEDQLTRAAMIVLGLVPAAREALLRLIDAPGLAQLGTVGEVDMQTRDVLGQRDGGSAEIDELISVFLVVPDESRPDGASAVESSGRGQRLDGVLRFGPDLVVVVESKVVEGADDWQTRSLNYGASEPRRSRQMNLLWHDLLEAWWRLSDLRLVGPAEELLIQDLLDFADEHFPALLPFTTLRRAAGHDGRVDRRLRAIMLLATRFQPRDRSRFVMLDEHLGTTSVQRAELTLSGDELSLELWPGESTRRRIISTTPIAPGDWRHWTARTAGISDPRPPLILERSLDPTAVPRRLGHADRPVRAAMERRGSRLGWAVRRRSPPQRRLAMAARARVCQVDR